MVLNDLRRKDDFGGYDRNGGLGKREMSKAGGWHAAGLLLRCRGAGGLIGQH